MVTQNTLVPSRSDETRPAVNCGLATEPSWNAPTELSEWPQRLRALSKSRSTVTLCVAASISLFATAASSRKSASSKFSPQGPNIRSVIACPNGPAFIVAAEAVASTRSFRSCGRFTGSFVVPVVHGSPLGFESQAWFFALPSLTNHLMSGPVPACGASIPDHFFRSGFRMCVDFPDE